MGCTYPTLITDFSRVDGRRPVTVETIGRRLKSAGLIATGGLHAAPATMRVTDAANLLIGANAARSAAEAPEAVGRFRGFRPWQTSRAGSDANLPGAIVEAETFGEALEAAISTAPVIEEAFLDFVRQAFPSQLPSFHSCMAFSSLAIVALEVDLVRGAYEAAFIRVVTRLAEKREVVLEIAYHAANGEALPSEGVDRIVTSCIGLASIRALHSAIYGPVAGPALRGEGASGDAPGGTSRTASANIIERA